MATPQDSMVAGLFSTPEQYQQQRQAVQRAQAIQMAQLDPFQQGQANIQMGFNRIADVGAGALGIQDPQLKLQSARQQILQGTDQTDPNSLAQAAQALNQAGDTAGARQLAQLAQEAALKQSQIVRNTREGRAAANRVVEVDGRQVLVNTVSGEKIADLGAVSNKVGALPEVAKLQQYREQLVTQFGESDPRVKEIDAAIAKSTRQGKTLEETMGAGLGAIASAMAGAQAKKAAEAGGTEVGKQTANVQGKYTALGSIKDAVDMLDKGIYSGGYGPAQELAAKYAGGILRKDRLANTQEFRAYIGDVVIPRLQEFGGNDSVEELNYLRSVMAGDTSMEGSAIKNILQKADRKIRAGIDRLEKQQTAVTTGKPLPIGDTSAPAAPKATKRFNPATGQVEAVK
jgi:hypothetical protein